MVPSKKPSNGFGNISKSHLEMNFLKHLTELEFMVKYF